MFGVMGTSAAFMRAAGAHKQEIDGNHILFTPTIDDPVIYQLSCSGDITIKSTKNGAPVIATYSNLEDTEVSIQADANTKVVIKGDVTKLIAGQYQGWGYKDGIMSEVWVFANDAISEIGGISGKNSPSSQSVVKRIETDRSVALQTFGIYNCTALTSLDLSNNTALTTFECAGCSGLTALDLSANTALETLTCSNCTGLTVLDLSANTALHVLDCSSCTGLTALDLNANTALETLTCSNCTGLTVLDLSANTALETLFCPGCSGLTALDLSANTALHALTCSLCTSLTALDLSANTALETLTCSDCALLTEIKYAAGNEDVSTAIAGAITNATAADGTVYTDSAAAYYSTIATAATTKGWTIEQLS